MMSGKRIVILMFPERGALNASFKLAYGLVQQGFHVTYLTNATYLDYVQQQGFDVQWFDLDPFYNRLNGMLKKINAKKFWLSRWYMRLRLVSNRNVRLEEYLERSIASVFEKPVDLLLLDPILMNVSIPFIKRAIPVMHLNTTFAYAFNFSAPPVFSRKVPAHEKSLFSNLHFALDWLLLVGKVWLRDARWNWKHGLVPTRSLNTARRRISRYLHRYRWGEYGFRLKCPELVLAPRDVDFDHIADADNRCYVGASVHTDRKDGVIDFDFDDRPILYCSLGTYSHHCAHAKKVYNAVLEMMADLPEWQAVVQIGTVDIGNMVVPPNVFIGTMVPQLKMLERAAVALIHGGCSSLKECVYTGTPMILVPWNNDGYGNSARVVYHQIGVRLDMLNISSQLLKKAFEEVSTSDVIRASIEKLQGAVKAQESCAAGVRYIENYLNARNYN